MQLSTLAICLGLAFALPQIFALVNPSAFAALARKFPRSVATGWVLTILATVWFVYNLQSETIADFAAYKRWMVIGFGGLGLLTCIFVPDFLAVRGFAALLLLLAHFTLNRARWIDTDWRLVLVVWAYTWVIAGLWFTVSPWRLRDYINWKTQSPARLRAISAGCLALAIVVCALGLTAFRQASAAQLP